MTSNGVEFFKTAKDFRRWLAKNHGKASDIWVGFFKKGLKTPCMNQAEALAEVLCFGWIYSVIKRVDFQTYKIRYVRRKPKSVWSLSNIRKFEELKRQKKVTQAGLKAFALRDRRRSEKKETRLSPAQLKEFKSHKKAWDFFCSQTPSYQHYTIWWVTSAIKKETQERRLQMLITDSSEESKLKRILAAQGKLKKVYRSGDTPIEEARNIGIVSGADLRSLGIDTVEKLKSMGWEKVFYRLCESFPDRINLNMLKSLIGAIEDQDWRKLDPDLNAEAKIIIRDLKKSWGSFR